MIKLSIVIPIYNGERFIIELVDSIEALNKEEFDSIELLLINDGSKDSSLSCCKSLASRYSNIRVFDKPNGGIADTRNFGLTKVRGEFITFCDQDDLCIKSYHRFIELLDQNNADVIISNYAIQKDSFVKITKRIVKDTLCDKIKIKAIIKRFLNISNDNSIKNTPLIYPTIWNCIFRTNTLKKHHIRIKKYVNYEDDWIFLFEVLTKSEKIYLCSDYYYKWFNREGSESHTFRYIQDFIHRRGELRKWYTIQINTLDLTNQEIEFATLLFDRETLFSSFNNYQERPLKEYRHWMNKITFTRRRIAKMILLSNSKKESITLVLFSYHFWTLVYFLKKMSKRITSIDYNSKAL